MAQTKSITIALIAGFALAGCADKGSPLFSSSANNATAAKSVKAAKPATVQQARSLDTGISAANGSAVPQPPPKLGASAPARSVGSSATGTVVGQKIQQLRRELASLQGTLRSQTGQLRAIRARTAENSRQYYMAVAEVNSRLQVGTTRGNPVLVNKWNSAQSQLGRIDSDITALNGLANKVAGTSTLSAYLLETTRAAYGLTGAVDEDHRQLSVLEDEVSRISVSIDRLLNELSEDINRQINYVSSERGNLTTLALAIKNGELLGANLQNRAFAAAARGVQPLPSSARTAVTARPLSRGAKAGLASGKPAAISRKRRPLVVIRFDRPNVAFEQSLYSAVSSALERRPAAKFDLVAIAPKKGSAAQIAVASNTSKRNAESVLRSLSEMGLPLERVNLSAMTSTAARGNEVHIYVR